MGQVGTYLNFAGNTEEAFNFYRSVFGGEFEGGISRMGDVPEVEGQPPIPENAKNLVMHVGLSILGGHMLMGTDATEGMGFKVSFGNNVYISLHPETREETEKLFKALSEGGKIEMELQDTFWGAYYGSFVDKFGVQWMFNCEEK
ncbi:VOC family protein [Candidatus Peregrinibacteria bacterium HGW-Peregrinibacteria-1]|jgi:PhnB protein|nr:MAG: VOC family protein [Candidatus Peregrinibacteria bacterium HGW-Peregrinibacteria-1]